MPKPPDTGFAARRTAALEAKKELLKKVQSVPKPSPEELAARAQTAALKEARRVERELAKKAEAEAAAAEALRAKEEAERAAAQALREAADREVAEAAERKAERDRRYAARKARNK
jgi:uncharacterized protein DUF6481